MAILYGSLFLAHAFNFSVNIISYALSSSCSIWKLAGFHFISADSPHSTLFVYFVLNLWATTFLGTSSVGSLWGPSYREKVVCLCLSQGGYCKLTTPLIKWVVTFRVFGGHMEKWVWIIHLHDHLMWLKMLFLTTWDFSLQVYFLLPLSQGCETLGFTFIWASLSSLPT